MRFNLLFLLFFATLSAENPWGKDADLLQPAHLEAPEIEISFVRRFASILIEFHQNVVSPIDGPRSHYYPSSSQYTKDAIQKFGFFQGIAYGCDRLMRENDDPWVYGTCLTEDGRKLKRNLIP